tara:strand:+ start:890 stop:1063 length:174 start_codon:yes stop_codon:yes gene_type:complete
MEICLGMIGMRPKDFWNSSPKEIYAAISGFTEFNSDSKKSQPLTKSELHELMELYPD